MSACVAVLSEGPIDQVLLEPLLGAIARKHAGIDWPVLPDDCADVVPIRKRGFGGVVEKLRALIDVLELSPLGYDAYMKTLDELTARSPRLESRYGQGSLDLALDFAETWDPTECLERIRTECPQGFAPFVRQASKLFNRAKKRSPHLRRAGAPS